MIYPVQIHFTALRHLFCTGCGVTTLLSLRGLRSLEILVADRNNISDLIETADVVRELGRLRRLDLTGNPVCTHPMYLPVLLESASDHEGGAYVLEELDGRVLEPFEYSVVQEMRAIASSARAAASIVRAQTHGLSGGGAALRTGTSNEASLAPDALAALEAARSRVRAKFGTKSNAFCEALLSTSKDNTHLLEIAGSLMDESKRANALQMDALLHYINNIPLAIAHDEEEEKVEGQGAHPASVSASGTGQQPEQQQHGQRGQGDDGEDEEGADWPEVPVGAPSQL